MSGSSSLVLIGSFLLLLTVSPPGIDGLDCGSLPLFRAEIFCSRQTTFFPIVAAARDRTDTYFDIA